jgi:Helix-destabilising protein
MSVINVKVKDTFITVREGLSKLGKPYKISSQDIFLEMNDEVRKARINLADNIDAYGVGSYTLDPVSLLTVDQYGSLALQPYADIKLVPVAESAKSFLKQ